VPFGTSSWSLTHLVKHKNVQTTHPKSTKRRETGVTNLHLTKGKWQEWGP